MACRGKVQIKLLVALELVFQILGDLGPTLQVALAVVCQSETGMQGKLLV